MLKKITVLLSLFIIPILLTVFSFISYNQAGYNQSVFTDEIRRVFCTLSFLLVYKLHDPIVATVKWIIAEDLIDK